MPGKSRAQQQREADQARAVARGEIKPREAYKHEFCRRAKDACFGGASNADLAELFAVDVSTIERWIKGKPLFARSVYAGRERANERVAKALYQRALGYSHRAQKVFNNAGKPLVVDYDEHYPPDTAAAAFWLSNRSPDRWQAKNGRPIELTFSLSDLIREAIGEPPMKAAAGAESKVIEPLAVELKSPQGAK
jgi:hypothetical protein